MVIQENVPLAPLTTLGVGGPARFFVEASTADEVREALRLAKSRGLALFVLGGGSNLVVSDAGWPGLVLKPSILGINHRHGRNGIAYWDVGAGEDWDGFVATTVQHHSAGVECLSGIPGSVGGTPVQNVGAYGQEVADTIDAVVAIDVVSGEEVEFEKSDCGFAYRTSIFNTTARGRHVILRVSYALVHDGEPRVAYADLQKYFAGRPKPTLAAVREAVRQIRASKAMLITAGDEDARSAGSFFKNPVLSAEAFADLKAKAAARGLEIPSYPALASQRKVSAAWLVEQSGFSKGYGQGRVGTSRKHALAIVNRGRATAAEVMALKDEIQEKVKENWGIRLEPEPVFLGF